MPAAFAHDLYGRLVFERLKPEVRRAVGKEKDCFYLGLHGPDVLFFYRALGNNPVNRKGYHLHEEAASGIFEHGLAVLEKEHDKRKKDAIRAYLLGFACHFALDCSLHRYINEKEKNTIYTHGEIETELERRLLIREGKTPLKTNVTSHIKGTEMTWMASSRVLSEDEVCLWEAIASFKTVNRLFINSGEGMKSLICLILRAAGYYEKIHGMIMRRRPVPGLSQTTDYLEKEFHRAVPFGVCMTEGLFFSMERGESLPREFGMNFEGEWKKENKEDRV